MTEPLELLERPRTRADCVNGPRPCPWIGCRYHLASDVRANGDLTFQRRVIGMGRYKYQRDEDEAVDRLVEMPITCALDAAEDGPSTLDVISTAIGVTRERTRQIEERALLRLRKRLAARDIGVDVLAGIGQRASNWDIEGSGCVGISHIDTARLPGPAARETRTQRVPFVSPTARGQKDRHERAASVRRAAYNLEEKKEGTMRRAEWAAEAKERLPEITEAAIAEKMTAVEFRRQLEIAGIAGLPQGKSGIYSWLKSERHRIAIRKRRTAGEYKQLMEEPTTRLTVQAAEQFAKGSDAQARLDELAVDVAKDDSEKTGITVFDVEPVTPQRGFLVLPDGAIWCPNAEAALDVSQRLRSKAGQ